MSASALRVGGVVLCGGRSRRMGVSKAWMPVGHEHLLQRMVRIVSTVVRPVVVAAHQSQSLPSVPEDVAVVHDAVDDGGPLAGMASGFDFLAGQCEAAFVTSCDHPLLRPQFIEQLITLLGSHPGVVPRDESHVYSLTAVYRLETRMYLAALLAERDLRVGRFVDRCGAYVVPAAELVDADPDLDSLRNINDPDAYAHMLRLLSD